MKNIYISGSITGNRNFEQEFLEAEKFLIDFFEGKDVEVVNPVKLARKLEASLGVPPNSLDYVEYMQSDLKELLTCDAICMLDGFEKSKGAKTELAVAYSLDYGIYQLEKLKALELTRLGKWFGVIKINVKSAKSESLAETLKRKVHELRCNSKKC